MKKAILIGFAVVLAIPLALATSYAQGGNGAPNGTHFNLNLLGKTTCPGDDLKGTNRHSIMTLIDLSDPDPNGKLGDVTCSATSDSPDCLVNLDRRNKIFLGPGVDFQVTDGNACDKDGAALTLPSNIATDWSIYVRELGKPGGTGDLVTCGISDMGTADTSDDEVVCSMVNVPLERKTGKSTFRNVTTELTTIAYQIPIRDAGGSIIGWASATASLFDPDFYQYFWDYDNNGLRLIQLRFYAGVYPF